MIEKGANPFIVDFEGGSHFDGYRQSSWLPINHESLEYLANLPSEKSVYFTIHPIFDEFRDIVDLPAPWIYQTGTFDGNFNSVVGSGASGIVISGKWCGKQAAYKFVNVGDQKIQNYVSVQLPILNKQLSEMTSIQETKGSKILSFYGHYRYILFFFR